MIIKITVKTQRAPLLKAPNINNIIYRIILFTVYCFRVFNFHFFFPRNRISFIVCKNCFGKIAFYKHNIIIPLFIQDENCQEHCLVLQLL